VTIPALVRPFLVLLVSVAACHGAAPAGAPPAVPQGQDAAPAKPARPAEPTAQPALPRVHVIGASLSGGFRDGPMTGAAEPGDTVALHQVLKGWCGEHARATTQPPLEMMSMFTNPEAIGERQLQAALKAKPDAVVALDFPFWFAYGYVKGDEGPARHARFTKGLAMLEKLEVPVLVGDLPDMKGATRRMLAPEQVPSAAVLKELNERLAAFAKQHANVRLVAIAELTRVMKEQGVPLPLATGPLPTPPGALLQGDKLHPNRLGMAMVGYTIQDALRSLFPEGHALRAQQWTFEQFVVACGAEQELDNVKAAAKGAAAGAPAGGK
jgi:hypothetical protein